MIDQKDYGYIIGGERNSQKWVIDMIKKIKKI